MPHYHIRWSSNPTLDWEAFPTSAEAQAQAEQLVKPAESYVIEQVDGDCPRCSSLPNLAGSDVAPTADNGRNSKQNEPFERLWEDRR